MGWQEVSRFLNNKGEYILVTTGLSLLIVSVFFGAAYGKDGAEAVQQLRGMEGLLNQANQCGDVAHIIDHGLVAMDQGEVATRD